MLRCMFPGVVDSNALMAFYEGSATQNGAEVLYNVSVEDVKPLTSPKSGDGSPRSLGYKLSVKVRAASFCFLKFGCGVLWVKKNCSCASRESFLT